MKICKQCNIEKYLSEYHKDKKGKDNHKTICKNCINSKQPLLRERINIIKWYKKIKAIKHLGGKCQHCSTDNVKHLTFHHIDPNIKEITITELLKGATWERIEKEINKCELLCHNCHNEHHYNMYENTNNGKLYFLQYKGIIKCQKCGYDKCSASLTFNHINRNDKLFNLSDRTQKNYTSIFDIEKEIIDELNKCEVLCGNCHFELDIDINAIDYVIKNYDDVIIHKTKKVDRTIVADMYFNQKMTQAEIRKKLNIAKSTIHGVIRELKNNTL